ncbi:globin family protein [Pelagibius sp.]|uniref:globin family protein n=1 Tax=Pelagibius sp. TaxID=1931238 RepID=UPI003B50799F
MTPTQKQVIKETWRQITPIAEAAATVFYNRLFEIDPSLKPLFAKTDMEKQGQKLMQAINHVVAGLEAPEALMPVLQDLGRRHAGYGVTEGHYDTVGAALLWTLERGLGNCWSDDAREAWAAAYALIAEVMIEAAREAA